MDSWPERLAVEASAFDAEKIAKPGPWEKRVKQVHRVDLVAAGGDVEENVDKGAGWKPRYHLKEHI